MKKLFIWDYHGTLEKGNEHVVFEYTNMALERMGYSRRLTREENHKLYGIPWYQYFEHLLPEEPHEQHLKIQDACLAVEEERPELWDKFLRPNDGVHEVVKAIYESDHDQIIISNTEVHVMPRFVSVIGLNQYFPEGKYFATNTNLGSKMTKHDILMQYVADKKFDHLVTVGDRSQDHNFLNGYPHTSYLYAHPGTNFQNYPATYRIRDLRDILKEL